LEKNLSKIRKKGEFAGDISIGGNISANVSSKMHAGAQYKRRVLAVQA